MIPKDVNIGAAIAHLMPGAEFTVVCDPEGDRIEWRDQRPKPSDQEIVAAWEDREQARAEKKAEIEAQIEKRSAAQDFLADLDPENLDLGAGTTREVRDLFKQIVYAVKALG